MNKDLKFRIQQEALYLIETKTTVREIATKFKRSKSSIHKDLHERLKKMDETLYQKVDEIFKEHLLIRHIRGGESTRIKYLEQKKKKGIGEKMCLPKI